MNAIKDPEKDIAQDLQALRHTLLNDAITIAQLVKTVEKRTADMSKALKIFTAKLNIMEGSNDSLD